jgi:hypothetical protein
MLMTIWFIIVTSISSFVLGLAWKQDIWINIIIKAYLLLAANVGLYILFHLHFKEMLP